MVEESWEILGSVHNDAETVTSSLTTKTNVVYPDYFDYYNDYVQKTGKENPITPTTTITTTATASPMDKTNTTTTTPKHLFHKQHLVNDDDYGPSSSPALTAYPIYDEKEGHTQRLFKSPSAATKANNKSIVRYAKQGSFGPYMT